MQLPVTRFIRTAAVAAVVGAAGLVALPAQAAPYFSFGFGVGPGYHAPYYPGPYDGHYRPHWPRPVCMSDSQIRRALERAGYSNVRIGEERGPLIRARAVRGNWVYAIDYNRCRGFIESVRRLRRT